jgi:hypothetical protein
LTACGSAARNDMLLNDNQYVAPMDTRPVPAMLENRKIPYNHKLLQSSSCAAVGIAHIGGFTARSPNRAAHIGPERAPQ